MYGLSDYAVSTSPAAPESSINGLVTDVTTSSLAVRFISFFSGVDLTPSYTKQTVHVRVQTHNVSLLSPLPSHIYEPNTVLD